MFYMDDLRLSLGLLLLTYYLPIWTLSTHLLSSNLEYIRLLRFFRLLLNHLIISWLLYFLLLLYLESLSFSIIILLFNYLVVASHCHIVVLLAHFLECLNIIADIILLSHYLIVSSLHSLFLGLNLERFLTFLPSLWRRIILIHPSFNDVNWTCSLIQLIKSMFNRNLSFLFLRFFRPCLIFLPFWLFLIGLCWLLRRVELWLILVNVNAFTLYFPFVLRRRLVEVEDILFSLYEWVVIDMGAVLFSDAVLGPIACTVSFLWLLGTLLLHLHASLDHWLYLTVSLRCCSELCLIFRPLLDHINGLLNDGCLLEVLDVFLSNAFILFEFFQLPVVLIFGLLFEFCLLNRVY